MTSVELSFSWKCYFDRPIRALQRCVNVCACLRLHYRYNSSSRWLFSRLLHMREQQRSVKTDKLYADWRTLWQAYRNRQMARFLRPTTKSELKFTVKLTYRNKTGCSNRRLKIKTISNEFLRKSGNSYVQLCAIGIHRCFLCKTV